MYSPKQPLGTDVLKDVSDWAYDEFKEIEKGFQNLEQIRIAESFVEPAKKRDGDMAFADGTDWDPGDGRGMYVYFGGAWNKMGFDPNAGTITGNVGGTDNRLVRSSGASGTVIDSTGITVDDSNNMSGVAALTATSLDLTTALAIADGGTGQTTQTAAFDALAPTTTQGDIIYHNGTDNVRLAPGTAGQFLQTQGAGANPQWAGASPIILSGALSNQATLDIPVSSAYDIYEINLVAVVPVTDSQSLLMRVSQGGSFLTGGSDYFYDGITAGVTGPDEANDFIVVSGGTVGNGAAEGVTLTILVFRPGASSFQKNFIWFGFARSTTPVSRGINGGGGLAANTNAIDAVRFFFTNNINTGYYFVRGYKA